MKKWEQLVILLAVVIGVGAVMLPPSHALAINVFSQCSSNASSAVCKAQGTDNATSMIKIVINLLLFVLGIIAVIMIIIGGLRYTTSGGNSNQTKEAKDTIVYAVVGLVIAILSFAIVNFVVTKF